MNPVEQVSLSNGRFFLAHLLTNRQNLAIWAVCVPVVLGLAWLAHTGLSAVAAAHVPAAVDPAPIAVRTGRLTPETLSRAIRYSGSVKEWQRVDLSFRVGGVVSELLRVPRPGSGDRDLQEGDRFPKGTVLARLDPTDYKLERDLAAERLAQAENKLGNARAEADNASREYERSRRLLGSSVISQSDYDTARTKYVSTEETAKAAVREVGAARVQLAQAETNLGYCTLVMPYANGTVAARTVETGERIPAGQKVLQIIDLSSVRIAFGVSDTVVGRLTMGATVLVTTDALPDERFYGLITRIAPTADAQTRTYLVEVRIAEPRGLRQGMIATAVLAQDVTATLLPMVAITREGTTGRLVAFKAVRDGNQIIARACPVELAGVVDNRAALRLGNPGGLGLDDEIVLAGAPRLYDGAVLKVIGETTKGGEGGR
jgi:multidrug efflux system membrane fusion protein